MDLQNAVCVVTGAGNGIGEAMAGRFAREGAAAVMVSDRDATAATRVAAGIGASTMAFTCDVTDEADGLLKDRDKRLPLVDRIEATSSKP